MKKIPLLSLIALISCLYSCNFKSNQSSDTTVDSVVVIKKVLQDSYHLSGDTAMPGCKVSLSLEIPVQYKQDSDCLHLQKILTPLVFGEKYAGDTLLQAAQKIVDSHIADYKAEEPEFKKILKEYGEAYSFEWSFNYTLAPLYNRNDFFCYGLSTSEYTGGAHGIYSDLYYTIDLASWRRIMLDDIFQPGSIDRVNRVLLDQLLKNLNLTTPDSLLDLGYFATEGIGATDNFYLTDNGVCWVYNPYEIACYATGQTFIEVPFTELEMYFLPDTPIRRLIQK